jgi:hypothetical protein
MPGVKYNIPVEVSDAEIHEHARVTVGFSKFASLHLQNCIMAGVGGTHSMCVCMCSSPKCEVNVGDMQNS